MCTVHGCLQDRRRALWRSLSAGLPFGRKVALKIKLKLNEWALWLLVAAMYTYEAIALRDWLNSSNSSPAKA